MIVEKNFDVFLKLKFARLTLKNIAAEDLDEVGEPPAVEDELELNLGREVGQQDRFRSEPRNNAGRKLCSNFFVRISDLVFTSALRC